MGNHLLGGAGPGLKARPARPARHATQRGGGTAGATAPRYTTQGEKTTVTSRCVLVHTPNDHLVHTYEPDLGTVTDH